MKYVQPGFLQGSIEAPPSKSMMQRAVYAATLAHGRSAILNPSYSDDGFTSLRAAESLGAKIKKESAFVEIEGGLEPRASEIHCGESGLSLRMLCAIASLYDKAITLRGEGSLLKRPIDMVIEPLETLGVSCESNNGYLPLKVCGPLRGGTVEVDGSKSSQFLSGLLMALPCCKENSYVKALGLKSKPYVHMTLEVLNEFGIYIDTNENLDEFHIAGNQRYNPSSYTIEGDWSGAAFFLVAGAISGSVTVKNLNPDSSQADLAILGALKSAGLQATFSGKDISIEKSPITAFDFDASECPDLFPPLAVLACYANGQSRIFGSDRLHHKESNRAKALSQELSKMGAKIQESENCLLIEGTKLHGAETSSHNDHRIAMACAIAALGCTGPVSIQDPDCVAKSYPGFFEALESLYSKNRSR